MKRREKILMRGEKRNATVKSTNASSNQGLIVEESKGEAAHREKLPDIRFPI